MFFQSSEESFFVISQWQSSIIMAIINFGLKKEVSPEQLQAILDGAIKIRDRGEVSPPKRVYSEVVAVDSYLEKQKITNRGDTPIEELFPDAYKAMEKEEQKLYQVWQIELKDTTIDAQRGGLESIVASLNSDPNVEFAEENNVYRFSWTPNDPQLSNLYGLKKIECEKAWNLSRGKGVVVAVVDSGVNVQHVDLSRNLLRDSSRKVIGYNFADNNPDVNDIFGHGTHVAGIIAAIGNNNQGVIGVAPEAKIMPVKAFRAEGRTLLLWPTRLNLRQTTEHRSSTTVGPTTPASLAIKLSCKPSTMPCKKALYVYSPPATTTKTYGIIGSLCIQN